MPKDKSVTPKATLTLNSIGKGFTQSNVGVGATTTLKLKKPKFTGSLAFSDKTISSVPNVKALKDVVAQVDYKVPKNITLNGKYEFGPKKYTAGATWDGTVAKKGATLKLWYTNKDNLVSGEATLNLNKTNKVNTTFNQKQLQTAKYTLVKNDFTVEPSYNFIKKAPAVAVTKKLSAKDSLKIAYDLKSEGATAEWARKPFKVALSSTVSKKLQVGRPSLAVTFENTYDF